MRDFIFLMHDDGGRPTDAEWGQYIAALKTRGCFDGGSAIGGGIAMRKVGDPGVITSQVTGFIRVHANDLDEARAMMTGNPAFEAGCTVEIRELPAT